MALTQKQWLLEHLPFGLIYGSFWSGLNPVSLNALSLRTGSCVFADTKAWEVDTLRGHINNVSCVLFHARSVSACRPQCHPHRCWATFNWAFCPKSGAHLVGTY